MSVLFRKVNLFTVRIAKNEDRPPENDKDKEKEKEKKPLGLRVNR